ncbi:hypothetical protein AAHA92_12738 [Salvia divinorum]|uniref:Apple domain-containing protein n=1 Tax=Salvia divinorum TaxID=28513 RepID=A0ABD1HPU6_SALDI
MAAATWQARGLAGASTRSDLCRETVRGGAECLRNYSCMAYTQVDIKREIGCLIWYHDLIDIRTMSQDGQVFYVRMASSEADDDSDEGKKREILIASLVSVVGVVVLVLALSLYVWRRKMKNYRTLKGEGKCENQLDLPFLGKEDLVLFIRASWKEGKKLQ